MLQMPKYRPHGEACWGRQTCIKCNEKDPDPYPEEDYLKEIRCANCRQDQPVYARSWDVKKIGNTWGETQEEWVLPGSKENCREKTAMPLLHGERIQPMKTNIEHSWRNWSSWKRRIG